MAVRGGSVPGEVVTSGTIYNIKALFASGGVKYTSALDSNDDDTFTITISDNGNTGAAWRFLTA